VILLVSCLNPNACKPHLLDVSGYPAGAKNANVAADSIRKFE
jgi:hypothetical protein